MKNSAFDKQQMAETMASVKAAMEKVSSDIDQRQKDRKGKGVLSEYEQVSRIIKDTDDEVLKERLKIRLRQLASKMDLPELN